MLCSLYLFQSHFSTTSQIHGTKDHISEKAQMTQLAGFRLLLMYRHFTEVRAL